MMRIIRAFVVPILLVTALASCGGKLKKPDPTPVETPVERPAYGFIHRAVTYHGTTDASGATTFARTEPLLELGEPLVFLGKITEGVVEGAQDRMALIRTEDGQEVWVRERYIVVGGQLAVITASEAVLYSKPKDISPTSNVLTRGTLVVAYPEDFAGFHKVSGWDHKAVHAGVFLKAGTISLREDDVQSALLYYLAGVSANEVVKRELLRSAALYADSILANEISRALKEAEGKPADDSPTVVVAELGSRPAERFEALAKIARDGVNVRSLPIETGSDEVARLNAGKPVVIVARTRGEFVVAGNSARWYRIAEPVDGWVYGAFVNLP